MPSKASTFLWRILVAAVALLILKITAEVLLGYVNYFPPNFDSDFLRGRRRYFFGAYQWAFYPHLVSGPASLLFGLVLINESLRRRFPKWHRVIGRVQVANVVGFVAPSGIWMSLHAVSGPVATVSFMILALLTAWCCACGWHAAMKRQFAIHRRWMERCFVLLCSAVVIRLLGGLGTMMEVQATWFDPVASWVSWVVPLLVFELSVRRNRIRPQAASQHSPRPSAT